MPAIMISAVTGSKRERDRQEERDGGGRTDTRQHPDGRAQHHAEEAEEQVLGTQRGGQAEPEVVEELHRPP